MVEFSAICNAEAALAAVEIDGDALRFVPKALMIEAVVSKAVESDGYALRFVPEALMSEAVLFKAVEIDGDALRYVLKKSLFISVAAKFGIPINIKDQAVIVKSQQAR